MSYTSKNIPIIYKTIELIVSRTTAAVASHSADHDIIARLCPRLFVWPAMRSNCYNPGPLFERDTAFLHTIRNHNNGLLAFRFIVFHKNRSAKWEQSTSIFNHHYYFLPAAQKILQ